MGSGVSPVDINELDEVRTIEEGFKKKRIVGTKKKQ